MCNVAIFYLTRQKHAISRRSENDMKKDGPKLFGVESQRIRYSA